jgi:hypothetical protein
MLADALSLEEVSVPRFRLLIADSLIEGRAFVLKRFLKRSFVF